MRIQSVDRCSHEFSRSREAMCLRTALLKAFLRMDSPTQGIVGGSYARLTARTVATFSNDFRIPGVEAEFKMDGYFSTAHKHNAFGVGTIAAAGPSRLVEHDRAAFPMQIRANGVPSKLAEASPTSPSILPSRAAAVWPRPAICGAIRFYKNFVRKEDRVFCYRAPCLFPLG